MIKQHIDIQLIDYLVHNCVVRGDIGWGYTFPCSTLIIKVQSELLEMLELSDNLKLLILEILLV